MNIAKLNKYISIKLFWAFVIFNILYISVLPQLVEIGENMRFRFNIYPLLFIVTMYGINLIWNKLSRD